MSENSRCAAIHELECFCESASGKIIYLVVYPGNLICGNPRTDIPAGMPGSFINIFIF
jgi:hypothetical protein